MSDPERAFTTEQESGEYASVANEIVARIRALLPWLRRSGQEPLLSPGEREILDFLELSIEQEPPEPGDFASGITD